MRGAAMRRLFLSATFACLFIFWMPPAIGAQQAVVDQPPAAPVEVEETLLPEKQDVEENKGLQDDASSDANPAEALKAMRESLRLLRERQADIGADMTALADQVRKLRGELEELSHPERITTDRREMQAALDDLSARMRIIENLAGAGSVKSPVKDRKVEAPPASPAEARKPDIKEIYTDAFDDFKTGQYDRARQKFQAFLESFPDASLASGAQFWLGESYYVEGDMKRAILEYEKAIKNYPKGEMVPHALLKQGLSFLKIGDKTGARILLEKLTADYPDTHQARIAASTLATLK